MWLFLTDTDEQTQWQDKPKASKENNWELKFLCHHPEAQDLSFPVLGHSGWVRADQGVG